MMMNRGIHVRITHAGATWSLREEELTDFVVTVSAEDTDFSAHGFLPQHRKGITQSWNCK